MIKMGDYLKANVKRKFEERKEKIREGFKTSMKNKERKI